MPWSRTLLDLAAQNAAVTIEKQLGLEERLPDQWDWEVDLTQQPPRLRLGGLVVTIALLGTAAEDGTWLWSWGNPGFEPDHPAVAAVLPIREIGIREDIPELVGPEVDLSPVDGYDLDPPEMVLVNAAMALIPGAAAFFRGQYPNGWVYLLIDDPTFPPPPLNPVAVARMLINGTSVVPMHQHARVVTGYVRYHGGEVNPTNDGFTGSFPDGTPYTVKFDEHGRFADWKTLLSPETTLRAEEARLRAGFPPSDRT